MDDVPPPRLAPRGRPTLITDLPTDVLSYIISLVVDDPLHQGWRSAGGGTARGVRLYWRVRLSVVCRAFADAVRPPSAVWADVDIAFSNEDNGKGLREHRNAPSEQGAYGTLERAMQVAGPCVRCFSIYLYCGLIDEVFSIRVWAERVLATTPRVHHVNVNSQIVVDGPPPMVSAGRAAILDWWRSSHGFTGAGELPARVLVHGDYVGDLLALHCHLVAAGRQAGSVAARTVPVLTSMQLDLMWGSSLRGSLDTDMQRRLPFIRSFAADVGQHLTRLRLDGTNRRALFVLRTFLDHLPALQKLYVSWSNAVVEEDLLDLRPVVTPPPGLTCLVASVACTGTVFLPPAIMARLEVMGLGGRDAREPPACLRGAGNSFRCLTRLVYGRSCSPNQHWADLAGWATPAFAMPALVVLEVAGVSFTLGAADGPAWAAAVASTTLPRLERLALFYDTLRRRAFEGSTLMPADAVAEAITRSLPAAAAAAGRSLSVSVQGWDDWGSVWKKVNPQMEEHFETSRLEMKYEARPVR